MPTPRASSVLRKLRTVLGQAWRKVRDCPSFRIDRSHLLSGARLPPVPRLRDLFQYSFTLPSPRLSSIFLFHCGTHCASNTPIIRSCTSLTLSSKPIRKTNDWVVNDTQRQRAPTQELPLALRFHTTMDDLQGQYFGGDDSSKTITP